MENKTYKMREIEVLLYCGIWYEILIAVANFIPCEFNFGYFSAHSFHSELLNYFPFYQ